MNNQISKQLRQAVNLYIACHYQKEVKTLSFHKRRVLSKPMGDITPRKEKIAVFEDKEQYSIRPKRLQFQLDESFGQAVLRAIDEKGLRDPDVYNKAGIDRKVFSSLRSNPNYRPSKKTAIALCLALELTLKQSNDLLKKAGFTLSNSNMFDVIVQYFIEKRRYNFFEINEILFENDQETFY